jgi:hypothetical protein
MTKINYNKKKPHNHLNFVNINIKLLLLLTIIFSILILLPIQAVADVLENSNEIKDTPAGINVVIEFEEIGLNITFANVTKSGNTSISPSTTCPSPPDGFDMVDDHYNISTTAEHTGNITICINYNDSDIIAEKFLKVFHYKVEVDEFYAYEQSGINTGDTIWSLTGASYPDILDSNNEILNFIIDSQNLEINGSGDNFVYDTSIYSSNGETLIGWLSEPFSVIEKSSNWYISRLLINEDEDDSHLISEGNSHFISEGDSLNLGECFMLTLLEVDDNGREAQFSITKCGEEFCNFTVKENTFFEYNEDLNNSGCKDNWILKFNVETVFAGMNDNLVKINSIQFRSPDVIIIETPDTGVLPGFTITSEHNDNMLEVRLNSADDNIKLQKGGTVNIVNDRFRFKLDEVGNTGGILHPMSITRTWEDITSSLKTDDNIITGIVTDLSEFIIAEEIDTIPPVIYNVTINNSTPNVGDIVLVTVSVTDNNRVDRVTADRVALTYQGGDIWIGNITAELGSEDICIRAWDATGLNTNSYIACSTVVVNTPIGTDVQVDIPEIGAFLIFENVTQRGWTYSLDISEDISPPGGFYVLSDYYTVITTAKYTGNITVCLTYNDTVDENNITILQYEQIEDQTEVFAITQDNINMNDTIWNLTAADYPDVLCEGSKETLKFIINGPELEIKGIFNFVYDTSIYYQNGEPFIAWLDEEYFVVESGSDWYLSKMLIDETLGDNHSLIVGESMNLFDGFAITPVEVDVDGEEAWFMATKDGKYLGIRVIHEGKQYIYREDLNESGRNDNWVIKFNVNSVSVSPDNNLVNISGLKQISTDLLKIETPDSDLFDGFDIDTVSHDRTIRITFDKSDDKIQLIKGGVVNLIGDKYRFKLDEQGDVGGILNRQEVTKWNDVTISVDNNTNTVCGIVTDLSGFVIAEPINITWREVWTGENSPGGTGITTTELQDAIHHWLEDISIGGHILTTADLQEIIALWLLE